MPLLPLPCLSAPLQEPVERPKCNLQRALISAGHDSKGLLGQRRGRGHAIDGSSFVPKFTQLGRKIFESVTLFEVHFTPQRHVCAEKCNLCWNWPRGTNQKLRCLGRFILWRLKSPNGFNQVYQIIGNRQPKLQAGQIHVWESSPENFKGLSFPFEISIIHRNLLLCQARAAAGTERLNAATRSRRGRRGAGTHARSSL